MFRSPHVASVQALQFGFMLVRTPCSCTRVLLFLTAVRWRPMGKSGANGLFSAQGSSRKWQHPWHVCWGSFGSLKGRSKGNACLIVFVCVRHAYKGDTWSLWTCIWLPFAICLLMQNYFPNISLVRVDPRSTRYRQRSRYQGEIRRRVQLAGYAPEDLRTDSLSA